MTDEEILEELSNDAFMGFIKLRDANPRVNPHMIDYKWCDDHKAMYSGSCEYCDAQSDLDLRHAAIDKPKCECGAHKVKDAQHSSWCACYEN